jgi:hypothetical protein
VIADGKIAEVRAALPRSIIGTPAPGDYRMLAPSVWCQV